MPVIEVGYTPHRVLISKVSRLIDTPTKKSLIRGLSLEGA